MGDCLIRWPDGPILPIDLHDAFKADVTSQTHCNSITAQNVVNHNDANCWSVLQARFWAELLHKNYSQS